MGLEPGSRLGIYEIRSALGAGGMGVSRAGSQLDRDVAVKILPDAVAHDSERLARFDREARLLAQINHPHIASVYGLEDEGGRKFLVLEFVDGESLAERLSSSPLPVAESLRLARQVVDALEAAHERGVIHRDLKPANIMITGDGQVFRELCGQTTLSQRRAKLSRTARARRDSQSACWRSRGDRER